MTRSRGDPVAWPPLGFGYWQGLLDAWQMILERWAVEMGEQVEPVRGADRVDKTLSTSGADLVPGGPELVAGAELAPPDTPADIPHERQPIGLQATRHIRRTLTRTTRRDLGRAMVDMCEPGGWRASTLNPDLPDPRKFAILSDRFDNVAQTDDPHVLYGALLGLAAAAAGWPPRWRHRLRRLRLRRGSRPRRRQRNPMASSPTSPARSGSAGQAT